MPHRAGDDRAEHICEDPLSLRLQHGGLQIAMHGHHALRSLRRQAQLFLLVTLASSTNGSKGRWTDI